MTGCVLTRPQRNFKEEAFVSHLPAVLSVLALSVLKWCWASVMWCDVQELQQEPHGGSGSQGEGDGGDLLHALCTGEWELGCRPSFNTLECHTVMFRTEGYRSMLYSTIRRVFTYFKCQFLTNGIRNQIRKYSVCVFFCSIPIDTMIGPAMLLWFSSPLKKNNSSHWVFSSHLNKSRQEQQQTLSFFPASFFIFIIIIFKWPKRQIFILCVYYE